MSGISPQETGAYLDAKGLICPLPVLRARKRLAALEAGDVLTVEATDPSAKADFVAFCTATGHRLLDITEESGVLTIRIETVARP